MSKWGNKMNNRFEQFFTVISAIYRYIQKLQRSEMVKRGYKGAFAQYLMALNKTEEGLTSKELCEVCDKDKAAVSRIIAEMEEKGLIQREKSNTRAYRSKITLTEKGKSTAEYINERSRQAVKAVSIGAIDEEQREIVYSVLDTISKNLQKVIEEGIPQEEEEE